LFRCSPTPRLRGSPWDWFCRFPSGSLFPSTDVKLSYVPWEPFPPMTWSKTPTVSYPLAIVVATDHSLYRVVREPYRNKRGFRGSVQTLSGRYRLLRLHLSDPTHGSLPAGWLVPTGWAFQPMGFLLEVSQLWFCHLILLNRVTRSTHTDERGCTRIRSEGFLSRPGHPLFEKP